MKYGFEREYWMVGPDGPVILPKDLASVLTYDECGYLLEARGDPHSNPIKAACFLLAEETELFLKARKKGIIPSTNPSTYKLTPAFRKDAWKLYGKNPYNSLQGNIYGKEYKPSNPWFGAGLHVHFSNSTDQTISVEGQPCKECGHRHKETRNYSYPGTLDLAKIVQMLDTRFKQEITEAKRLPGLYELKSYGFEYRSLPASVEPLAVAEWLRENQEKFV